MTNEERVMRINMLEIRSIGSSLSYSCTTEGVMREGQDAHLLPLFLLLLPAFVVVALACPFHLAISASFLSNNRIITRKKIAQQNTRRVGKVTNRTG